MLIYMYLQKGALLVRLRIRKVQNDVKLALQNIKKKILSFVVGVQIEVYVQGKDSASKVKKLGENDDPTVNVLSFWKIHGDYFLTNT
jgi:hypothetical protein